MKNGKWVSGRPAFAFGRTAPAVFLLAALAIGACLLAGCKKGVPMMSDSRTEKGYTLGQIMVVAMTEKNKYEDVCTDQIWKVEVENEGGNFSDLLSAQIRSFMEQMKLMNLLAREKNIDLTSEERADMGRAAKEYYSSLTDADIAYMGVTEEDAKIVFEEYRLAEKLVDEVTGDVNLEVSDNEAKVITLLQAETDSGEKAGNLAAAVAQEGADFQTCASELGIPVRVRQLGREESSPEFEREAFRLTTGQVSGVIQADGMFYVLGCVNDYEETATAERKERIYQERKWKAFSEIFEEFKRGINLTYAEDPWEALDLSGQKAAGNADFFAIYEKYAGQ